MTDSINPATFMPPATSRAEQYGRRLDLYLPTLKDDAARRAYLTRILGEWERRMDRFAGAARDPDAKLPSGKTDPTDDFGPPTIADYANTISEISARLSALKIVEAA